MEREKNPTIDDSKTDGGESEHEGIRNYFGKNKEAKEGWIMIERVLSMFGNEKARQVFLNLLEEYFKKYRAQKYSDITGYKKEGEGRASLHNKIIAVLQRLSFNTRPGSEEEKILTSLANRETLHRAVEDFFG